MTCYRKRDVQGILLLNKPVSYSSNAALQQVKHLYQAKKAGHTGSLDPLASGLLVVCFGKATKVTGFLLDADKRYVFRAKLGAQTTTGDTEGEIVQRRPVGPLTQAQVQKVLADFTGDISQIPPMYSALKHKGERLYRLARKGVVVERQPRAVTIHKLSLLSQTEDTLLLDATCSKGTYIRTLVEDIGNALDCGAHTIELHRVGVGPFQDDAAACPLERLEAISKEGLTALDDLLLPMEAALTNLPKVALTREMMYYIKQGQAVQVPQSPIDGLVLLFVLDAFIGIGEILSDGRVAPKRLVVC